MFIYSSGKIPAHREKADCTADKGHERLVTSPTAHSRFSVSNCERRERSERETNGERGGSENRENNRSTKKGPKNGGSEESKLKMRREYR